MAALNPLLVTLRESAEFQDIMKKLLETRPLVPKYLPQKTRDQTENLLELIKHNSSMQQGWDLLFQHLLGKLPQEI